MMNNASEPLATPSSHSTLIATGTMTRILVIKLRHHGDMLLITPVINTLKRHYPQAEIDILLYQETRQILEAHPAISQIFAIDRQWKKRGVFAHLCHERRLLKQLTARHYDLVLNLSDQWRSAVINGMIGAKVRLGFDFAKRQRFLWRYCHTQLVPTTGHAQQHTVEQNLSLLQPLSLPSFSTNVTMSYTQTDWQVVQSLLGQKGALERYIVIQPTSRWFFKCWSEVKMAQLLRALQEDGHTLILTSGPDENECRMVNNILAQSPSRGVISLAGQLTLRQLAALIDHAQLFIGVDSVPMHMAAALQTPCLALFGPSKLTFWHPWQVNGEVIWAGDYGPLPDPDAIDTQTDQRYLDAIPADVVISAARKLLS